MKMVQIDGGLGNQMFQYVFAKSLYRYYSNVFVSTFIALRSKQHNGIELTNVFGIQINENKIVQFLSYVIYMSEKICNRLNLNLDILRFFLNILGLKIYSENGFSVFDKTVFELNGGNVYFKGYWQSEKYFINNCVPMNLFQFNINKLNDKSAFTANVIKTHSNFVSVHIRRGDYLAENAINMLGNVCSLDYYCSAIDYFINSDIKYQLVFFSDDIEWVKLNFRYVDAIYVDWNLGKDSWQDMYLMTLCTHNIIANSSFSWWGAYLNTNPKKIVIAPQNWHKLHNAPDICPADWIRMK